MDIKDYCKVVTASGTTSVNAADSSSFSISFTCPTGYKAILATPENAGGWYVLWAYCSLTSQSTVQCIVYAPKNAQPNITVTAKVLCIRDI